MGKLTLKQAAAWCSGWVDPKYEQIEFLGADNDARGIQPGQLFVALPGDRDGHDFIPAAMEKGAVAVLCSRRVGDHPAIIVDDPRTALGDIAREERRRIGFQAIGVTGSVGKSTTKEMIEMVLDGSFRIAKPSVNHNEDIGIPMAILAMPEDTEVAVLEMDMNHFREISSIVRPDIAVIVNIGTGHMEHPGSIEDLRKVKPEILEGMSPDGKLMLNGNDPMLRSLPEKPAQEITYFGSDDGCAVRCEDIREADGTLSFYAAAKCNRFLVQLQLKGLHYVPDALAAVSIALELGIPGVLIQERLYMFRNMTGRLEIYRHGAYTIISDCYNAGPESMTAALEILGRKEGRKIAVLGDMLELGDCAWAEHYRIGRIAAENAELIFAYGPNADRVVGGAITGGMSQTRAKSFDTHEALVRSLKFAAKPGDVLLFKGSRGMHMERVLEKFLEEEK